MRTVIIVRREEAQLGIFHFQPALSPPPPPQLVIACVVVELLIFLQLSGWNRRCHKSCHDLFHISYCNNKGKLCSPSQTAAWIPSYFTWLMDAYLKSTDDAYPSPPGHWFYANDGELMRLSETQLARWRSTAHASDRRRYGGIIEQHLIFTFVLYFCAPCRRWWWMVLSAVPPPSRPTGRWTLGSRKARRLAHTLTHINES